MYKYVIQVDSWQKRYGKDEASRLMQWNNEPAPTYARINRLLPGALMPTAFFF